MPQFLFSAKSRDDEAVTERVDAANVSAARYALETRGYREITFHTDDMSTAMLQTLGIGKEVDDVDDEFWTPEMELASRRGSSSLSRLLSPLRGLAILWVPLLCATGFVVLRWHWRWPFWLMIFLDLWFLKFYALLVLPSFAYNSLLRASVWRRRGAVRRWVKIIRWLNRRGESSVPEFELRMRLATSLAAEGKLEEGLGLVSRFEKDPQIDRASYFGRLASVYALAKNYEEMSHCQKLAVEQGSGSAGELIDYACGMVQRQKKVAEAELALAQAKEKEITDLAACYVHFCEGMIAVEKKDFTAAKKSLWEALKLAAAYAGMPLMQGWRCYVLAYLCIATGGSGDKAKARELLRSVEPLLGVQGEDELLQRCRQAAA